MGAVDILKLHEIAVLMVYKLALVVFCLGRNLIRPDYCLKLYNFFLTFKKKTLQRSLTSNTRDRILTSDPR